MCEIAELEAAKCFRFLFVLRVDVLEMGLGLVGIVEENVEMPGCALPS